MSKVEKFRGYSVLIAEDSPDSRALLIMFLEELGFTVYWDDCGERAFHRLSHQTVDLVISDIQMPNGDGLWLLNRLRHSDNQTPVILISGGVMVTGEEVQLLRANGFLQKPFKRGELLALIENVLLKKRVYA